MPDRLWNLVDWIDLDARHDSRRVAWIVYSRYWTEIVPVLAPPAPAHLMATHLPCWWHHWLLWLIWLASTSTSIASSSHRCLEITVDYPLVTDADRSDDCWGFLAKINLLTLRFPGPNAVSNQSGRTFGSSVSTKSEGNLSICWILKKWKVMFNTIK